MPEGLQISTMKSLVPASLIKLVPIGDVDRDVLDYLALTIGESFDADCIEVPNKIDPDIAYSPTRRQYQSSQILSSLLALRDTSGSKILGLTSFDLFNPILTFVFGEAQLGGSAAVMSLHRLHQEFYGLPEDSQLLCLRCEKEATHELGHAYGLVHCRSYDCVMHYSNSVEGVDIKPSTFCSSCEATLFRQSDPASSLIRG
jgi:archaemetzincin